MEQNLENLINKEKSNTCLILGPGKTMTEFPFKKFKGKIIVIGNSAIRGQKLFTPDYWVISNSHFPVPYIKFHREIINKFKTTTFLFSDSALHSHLWQRSVSSLRKKLDVKWVLFDDRHFLFKKCKPELKCCKHIYRNKNYSNIQELVSLKYNYKEVAKIGGTVFEYALALSLILGFSKIYIQGVDLPFNMNKKKIKIVKNNDFLKYGELGYEYSTNFDNEILSYIKKINIKTQKIIKKKYTNIFNKKNNVFRQITYKIIKKIKNEFFNNFINYPAFSNDKKLIISNISLYSKIAKNNKIKIFNLSKNSSLNKIKYILYIKKYKS